MVEYSISHNSIKKLIGKRRFMGIHHRKSVPIRVELPSVGLLLAALNIELRNINAEYGCTLI